MATLKLLVVGLCCAVVFKVDANQYSYSVHSQNTGHIRSYITKDKKVINTNPQFTIPSKTGCKIVITKLGICGDADRSSGSVGYYASGPGGTELSWDAGQNNRRVKGSTTYRAKPAVPVNGRPRTRYDGYITFNAAQKNKHTFGIGQAVKIESLGSNDHDALYCYEQNPIDGQKINDQSRTSSYRALIMFDYDCGGPCEKEGQYRAKPTDPDSCSNCLECKTGSHYETRPCVSSSTQQLNRKCAPCSARPNVESYQDIPCTVLTNAKYTPCKKCASNEYELKGCEINSDRICLPHAAPCDLSIQYEAIPPAKTTDRLCFPRSKCFEDQYQAHPGTNSTDRICYPITPFCIAPVQYQIRAATSSSNLKCGLTRTCKQTEYEETAPTSISDRKCTSLSVCNDAEIESIPPTPTSDRVCIPINKCFECALGFYEVAKCNLALKIEEPTKCEKCRECDPQTEFASKPCTPQSNRQCESKPVPKSFERVSNEPSIRTIENTVVIQGGGAAGVYADGLVVSSSANSIDSIDVAKELFDLRTQLVELKALVAQKKD